MDWMNIIKGLPYPMQGILMQAMGSGQQPNYYTPSEAVQQIPTNQGVLAQPTKKVKPAAGPALPVGADRIENPEDPMAAAVAQQQAPEQLPIGADRIENPEDPMASPIAQALSGSASKGGGILDAIASADPATHFMAIGRALASAGSQDPAKVALGFMAEDRDNRITNAKIAEMEREKRKPISAGVPGVFLQPTANGGWETVVDQKALDAAKLINGGKFEDKVLLAILNKQLEAQGAGVKQDVKDASEARPQLNNLNSTLDMLKQGLDVVSNQGRGAQVAAIPGISAVANFFGNKDSAGNMLLNQIKVDKALQETARTKGAISDTEMKLFLSPTPDATADRETVWTPWLQNQINVLTKLKPFLESEVSRGDNPASRIGVGAPTGGGSKFTVPGLSEGASKYFSPK